MLTGTSEIERINMARAATESQMRPRESGVSS
jgi:hypothetical protein